MCAQEGDKTRQQDSLSSIFARPDRSEFTCGLAEPRRGSFRAPGRILSPKRRDWWHMHRTHHPRRSVWSKHRATHVCSGTDEPAERPFAFCGVLGCEARLSPAQGGMEVCGRLLAFRPPHSTAGENMHKLRSLQRTVPVDTWDLLV